MYLAKFFEPDTFIAVCAFVVALVAVFISIWQAVLSRRHNRLSVQPHLRVDQPFGKIILSSTGLGPARIRSISFIVDDRVYSGDSRESLAKALSELGLIGSGFIACVPRNGDVIRPGEEQELLAFTEFDKSSDRGKEIHDALNRFGLHVEYESLYGDKAELWE